MALNNFKKFFGGDVEQEENEGVDEEFYSTTRETYKEENGAGGSKMMLLEPRAYSESTQIADYLKARNSVVVNLKRVTPEQAKRIVDFLSGTIYAIQGDLKHLGGSIWLCTPNNVTVDGKITDDNAKKEEKETKNEEDDEFNW